MKRNKVLQILGILLILASFAILWVSRKNAETARVEAAQIVSRIQKYLPDKTFGMMDDYSAMAMPVYQIGGKDFSAVIEIPSLGIILPVFDKWDPEQIRAYPCRFAGTVYDGSLVVGGADQPGQFDCLDRAEIGAVVTVTDMTGAVFTYTVDRVGRSQTAEAEKLMDGSVDLTLFVRDTFSREYILVRCVAAGR